MYKRLRDNLEEKFEYWVDDIKDEDAFDLSEYDLTTTIERNDAFKLYRYMPATYYNIRNLETQKIHLSDNGMLNDVFEGIPKSKRDISYEVIKQLGDLAHMTCLTEEKNHVLMWSNYAEEHTGFCVEYDLKLLQKDKDNIIKHMFPVVYTTQRVIEHDLEVLLESHKNLKEAIVNGYVYEGEEPLDNILPMFLIKGKEWEYEKEWRIVYTKKHMYDENDDTLYNCNLKFRCVSAVYLGYCIEKEIRENIIEICGRLSEKEGRKIRVYQSKLSHDKYSIEYEEI